MRLRRGRGSSEAVLPFMGMIPRARGAYRGVASARWCGESARSVMPKGERDEDVAAVDDLDHDRAVEDEVGQEHRRRAVAGDRAVGWREHVAARHASPPAQARA